MTSLKGQHARPKRTLVATEAEQPPPQKRRKNTTTSPPPSFTSLPDEIILNCLARISKSHYSLLSLVSKTIRSLLSSPDLYAVRSEIGNTEPCLYISQRSNTNYDRWYTLDQTILTDKEIEDTFSLPRRITKPTSSASPPPQKPTTLAVGFEIYQMGGTINDEERPSSAVRVLDCLTHTWRDAPDMTVARKSAESAYIDGKIYVVGGTEGSKNRAECFDLKSQTWKPLPSPSDDNAKVGFRRGEIYAKSKHKKYAYDPKQERWKEVLKFGFGPESNSYGRTDWCVIDNVKFCVLGGKLRWCDSERRKWFVVKGLEDKSGTAIHLANHGGQIVLVTYEPGARRPYMPVVRKRPRLCCGSWSDESPMLWERPKQRIRCEVIKLEKRIGISGLKIRGEIVWSNFLTVPRAFDVLSCIIVTL